MSSLGIRFAWFVLGTAVGCGGRTDINLAGGATTSADASDLGHLVTKAGTGGASFTGLAPPTTQLVLFQATYRNSAWDNVFEGIYVTRDGTV